MAIERLTNLVLIVGITNVLALALLAVMTFYNVYAYRMLRELRSSESAERTIARPPGKRTTRYDSLDVPDTGQTEWTGPVTPYIPADRMPANQHERGG